MPGSRSVNWIERGTLRVYHASLVIVRRVLAAVDPSRDGIAGTVSIEGLAQPVRWEVSCLRPSVPE